MKKKRERLEVIHDILATVQEKGQIGPTRLQQLSNLSPKMFRDYIRELVETSLLVEEEISGRKMYKVSDEGFLFLERYRVFNNFIEKLGL